MSCVGKGAWWTVFQSSLVTQAALEMYGYGDASSSAAREMAFSPASVTWIKPQVSGDRRREGIDDAPTAGSSISCIHHNVYL